MRTAADVRRVAADEDAHGIERRTTLWSSGLVEERLRKATTLRAVLTSDRLMNPMTAGPEPENRNIIGCIGSVPRNDGVIDMATEALSWLRWLEPDDAGILGARLDGASWKSICWRYGISRPTADRRFRYALALIVWRLNGNARTAAPPSLRSLLGMRRAS